MTRENIIKILLLSLLIPISFFGQPYISGASEIDEIIEEAAFADGLVITGKGSLQWEYTHIDSTGERYENWKRDVNEKLQHEEKVIFHNFRKFDTFFAFKDNRMRCNQSFLEPNSSSEWISCNRQMAYNGEKTDFLLLDSNIENGVITPKGTISSNNQIPADTVDPRYHGMGIWGKPVGSFLENPQIVVEPYGLLLIENLELIGDNIEDDAECKVIKGELGNTNMDLTIWLATDQNYRPKKIVLSSPDKMIVIRNTFKKFDGVVWFPKLIKLEYYKYDNNSGEMILTSHEKIKLNHDYEINVDVSDNLFSLDFPAGLPVYDERTGKVIIK